MTKNKEPDLFIKELKNVFQKIVTMPIENENGSESPGKLNRIAVKNKIVSDTAYNFKDALKKNVNVLCYDCKFSNKGIEINKKIDILVGTQLLSKGFHFPITWGAKSLHGSRRN